MYLSAGIQETRTCCGNMARAEMDGLTAVRARPQVRASKMRTRILYVAFVDGLKIKSRMELN